MFRILIVEDQPEKLKNIIQLFESVPEFRDVAVEPVTDVTSAKRKLQRRAYHLLILDVSIPLSLSQSVDPFGGIKLLEEITKRTKFNVPVHIIGLTAYENVFVEAKQKFDENVFTLIKYDSSSDEWKEVLTAGIMNQIAAQKGIENFDEEYDYDIAFICALKTELDGLRNNGWNWIPANIPQDDTLYYRSSFNVEENTYKVIAACGLRMGMPNAASISMKIITRFRPRYLVMTGIMAGLKDKVNLGDIIVANPIWDWGSGKWSFEKDVNTEAENGNDVTKGKSIFQIDPFQYILDTKIIRQVTLLSEDKQYLFDLRTKFNGKAPNYDIRIHCGPVASGASVLSDQTIVNRIKEEQHRKLVGIEMEGYSIFCACENAPRPKPIGLCVKAVVDFGDAEKDDDYQTFGCYASAEVATTIVKRIVSE